MTIRYRRDLYKLLPIISEAVCCEVGVAEGYNSAEMLSWGIKYLYMVDMWECMPSARGDAANDQEWHNKNFEAAKKRVSAYPGCFEILRGPSIRMAGMIPNDRLDLIHIDGDHSYEGVKADLNAFYPKISYGGIVSGHDYKAKQYGVKRAVDEFASLHGLQVFVMDEDKEEDAGFYFIKS